MLLRIFYPCLLIFFLLTSIVYSSYGVEAVSPPDTVSVEYIKAIPSVQEIGDIVFVCRYYLNYISVPVETAQQTFFFAITDSNGTVIVSRPLPEEGYGHNIQCIYLTAAEVGGTSHIPSTNTTGKVWGPAGSGGNGPNGEYMGLEWKGAYSAIIMSNPTLFATVYTDDQPMVPADWLDTSSAGFANSVANGQSTLKDVITVQSQQMETYYPTLDYTTTVSATDKLTPTGSAFWQKRYGGTASLNQFFTTAATYITVQKQSDSANPFTGSYLSDLTAANNTLAVKTAFTNLGDTIGIPYWQVIAFGVLMIPTFMIVAGSVYGVTGNSKVAAITAAPIMFVISMLIPDAMLMILTGIAAFLVVVIMWRFV